jgi:dTDP-4-amino-4,6-dideoxygalactose transaminase
MILFNDTTQQWKIIREKCLEKIDKFLSSESEIILGHYVEEFEKNFSRWNKNRYAIGVSSGTDAIKIALKSLNPKGVIIQSNTWMSTLVAVLDVSQKFRIVDCDEYHQMDTLLLEGELKKEICDTVVVAHMYGHCCDMEKILDLKQKYKFKLVEDCSQSCGTLCFNNTKTGNFGEVSIFSLHPRKNLGACGDAGVIVTNNSLINQKCQLLRNLGSNKQNKHSTLGWNNRLDSIQAIILNEKIKYIDEWNYKKSKISEIYSKEINNKRIKCPKNADYCKFNSQYVYPLLVEKRDEFVSYMNNIGIQTRVQYYLSIEKLKCFDFLNIKTNSKKTNDIFDQTCSIPLHAFLKKEEIKYIIEAINKF